MLTRAKMSWGWWGEAALTAMYLYNRTPHSSLSVNVSPLSSWMNQPVSLFHLQVFRSTCFVINTSKSCKKSVSRATECKLLGYDILRKAYRLQIKGTTKIVWSCNVIFHKVHSMDRTITEMSEIPLPLAPEIPVDVDRPPADCGAARVAADLSSSVGGLPDDSVGEEDLLVHGETMASTNLDPVPDLTRPSRCSTCDRRPLQKAWEAVQSNTTSVPKSYKEAMRSDGAEGWSAAKDTEYDSWHEKEVYEVVEQPQDAEVIPSMLLFSRKTDVDGVEVRKRARCVARGDMQSQSSDDGPTLSSLAA
jgi:hypothetical protein